MNVYTTACLRDFPASEYGGLIVWVARDEEHLRELITSCFEEEAKDKYYVPEDFVSLEEVMGTARRVDTSSAGISTSFET